MKISGVVLFSSLMLFSTLAGAGSMPAPLEPLGGAWYKARSLSSVFSLIPRDGSPTLVILDFDNTLFHTAVYNKHQMAEWDRLQSVSLGHDADKMRSDFFLVRHYPTTPRPTELGHGALINRLHEAGCTTILISSRSSTLMPLTLRDLANEGISFAPPTDKPHLCLAKNVYRMYECQAVDPHESSCRLFHHENHIIHTNGMLKGIALNVLAAQFKLDLYRTIIILDDEPAQLLSYAQTLEKFATIQAGEESSLRYHLLHYQTPDPSEPLPVVAPVAKDAKPATLGQLSHPELATLVEPAPSAASGGGSGSSASHSVETVDDTPPAHATTPPSGDDGLNFARRTESEGLAGDRALDF